MRPGTTSRHCFVSCAIEGGNDVGGVRVRYGGVVGVVACVLSVIQVLHDFAPFSSRVSLQRPVSDSGAPRLRAIF